MACVRNVCLLSLTVWFGIGCRGPTSLDATDSAGNKAAQSPDASVSDTAPRKSVFVSGTAPAEAENRTISVTLLDGNQTRLETASATIRSGGFAVALEHADAATPAQVALFADINGDAVCNIAPTDLGALVALPANGNAEIALDANAQAPCHVFGDYNFSVDGNDFTPHNNQTLYAAIRDTKSNAFVTTPKHIKVVNGVWQLSFPGALTKGRAYELRYFADIQQTGVCQNHSWVAAIATATSNVSLRVTHDTPQTAICTNFPALNANSSP